MHQSLPNDPHNEKWAKLIIPQKKAAETMQDVNSKLNEYLKLSNTQLSNASLGYQNQAFKDISMQNEKLNNYHREIQTRYEELLRRKHFKPFPRLPTDNFKNDYIIDPDELTPLLSAGDERIKALEDEMMMKDREITKLASIVELLIEENKYLRDHIGFKNKDIAKILETIGLNDGEAVHGLKHQIDILNEENNLLISHLEDLKKYKVNYDIYCKDRQREVDQLQISYDELRLDLNDALRREEDLANRKSVLETKFQKAELRVMEVNKNVEDLVAELATIQKSETQARAQINNLKKELEDLSYKEEFELESLKQEIGQLKIEKTKLNQQINTCEKQIDSLKQDNLKLHRSNEEKQLELDDVPATIRELRDEIESEHQKNLELQQKDRELKDKNESLLADVHTVTLKIQQTENQSKQTEENLKNELKIQRSKLEQTIDQLKDRSRESLEEKDEAIHSLNVQINDMKRVMSRLREEKNSMMVQLSDHQNKLDENIKNVLAQKDNEIAELKNQIEEAQETFRDVETLRQQNEALEEEVNNLKETAKNFKHATFKPLDYEVYHAIHKQDSDDLRQKDGIRNVETIISRKDQATSAGLPKGFSRSSDRQLQTSFEAKSPDEFRRSLSPTSSQHGGESPLSGQKLKMSMTKPKATNTGGTDNNLSNIKEQSEKGSDHIGQQDAKTKMLEDENNYLKDLVKNLTSVRASNEANLPRREMESTRLQFKETSHSPSRHPDETSQYLEPTNESVDRVVHNILQKYQLKDVPDKRDLDRIFPRNERSRSRSGEKRLFQRDIDTTGFDPKDSHFLRESAVGFLSPVLSTTDRFETPYQRNIILK